MSVMERDRGRLGGGVFEGFKGNVGTLFDNLEVEEVRVLVDLLVRRLCFVFVSACFH